MKSVAMLKCRTCFPLRRRLAQQSELLQDARKVEHMTGQDALVPLGGCAIDQTQRSVCARQTFYQLSYTLRPLVLCLRTTLFMNNSILRLRKTPHVTL